MNEKNVRIFDKEGRSERMFDLYSRMLKDRIIIVNGEIEDFMAMEIVAQLLFLDKEDKKKDIKMYINSPGGVITAGMAIFDTMKFIKSKIHTICIGQAASMGAFLLSGGDKRSILPHARVMIHQPLGGASGQAADIQIQAKEIQFLKDQLNGLLAEHTKQDLKKIEKDTDRDFFMSAEEAKSYGIVDNIIKAIPKG